MIKAKNLKQDKQYYIVDENGCYDPIIIKFKVMKEQKKKRRKYVVVQFLKYLYDYGEVDVKYCNQKENEIVTEKLYKEDEQRLFNLNEFEKADELLAQKIEEHDEEMEEFELGNYIPPEEYPDWDGDESIMYMLDL